MESHSISPTLSRSSSSPTISYNNSELTIQQKLLLFSIEAMAVLGSFGIVLYIMNR